MRLLFDRLVLMTGRQLRHLIGAAIQPPTRSPENAGGQDGGSHAAVLAVSTSRFSHDPISQSTAVAIPTIPAEAAGSSCPLDVGQSRAVWPREEGV